MERVEYSGKQVERSGKALHEIDALIEDQEKFDDVMAVLSYWRYSHEKSLDAAWSTLQQVAKKHDSDVILAKRMKRYASITKKLNRFGEMSLKNMQDIGGCRAIFVSQKKLTKVVRELRRMAEFKNSNRRIRSKDYIKNPKDDGYRSYHLVGRFPNGEGSYRNIEIQLRTRLQHYWATALEIVDLFTGQALKSNEGEAAWKEFFLEVSRQFSVMDQIHMFRVLPTHQRHHKFEQSINTPELLDSRKRVQQLFRSLSILKKFGAFAGTVEILDERLKHSPKSSYVLLQIDTQEKNVTSTVFDADQSQSAEAAYIDAEKSAAQNGDHIVALVSSAAVGGIREAYPNYFADSSEFIGHLKYVNNRT